MFSFLEQYKLMLWPFGQRIWIEDLPAQIHNTRAAEWHFYAIRQRHRRLHVCLACSWLAQSLGKNSRIFEAACGSGINLIWMGLRGFKHLAGSDLSRSAVALSQSLAGTTGIRLQIRQEDALNPQPERDKIDGLISVNWLYHIEKASLEVFLNSYRQAMSPHGKVVFDMIDASYNKIANNEYHTDDHLLPVAKRRPSEYKIRMSIKQVRAAIQSQGYRLVRQAKVGWRIPRTVWFIEALS